MIMMMIQAQSENQSTAKRWDRVPIRTDYHPLSLGAVDYDNGDARDNSNDDDRVDGNNDPFHLFFKWS